MINKLQEEYDEKGTVDLSVYNEDHIHSIAAVLKLYLRELPEPLFVFRFYSAFLRVASKIFYSFNHYRSLTFQI